VFYNDGKSNLTEQIISNAKGHNDPVGDVTGGGSLDILNSGHGILTIHIHCRFSSIPFDEPE
jgi:hypothetical protein